MLVVMHLSRQSVWKSLFLFAVEPCFYCKARVITQLCSMRLRLLCRVLLLLVKLVTLPKVAVALWSFPNRKAYQSTLLHSLRLLQL